MRYILKIFFLNSVELIFGGGIMVTFLRKEKR